MISYEELCQALERFNARRRNEAELAALERTEAPAQAAAPSRSRAATTEPGFAHQPPEDTHEIDVDDMVVEDRLADDKLRGI